MKMFSVFHTISDNKKKTIISISVNANINDDLQPKIEFTKKSGTIPQKHKKDPFEFIVIHDSLDLFLSFYIINPPNIDIVRFNNTIDLPLL